MSKAKNSSTTHPEKKQHPVLPPHSEDLERAVLGSLLIDEAAILKVVDMLTPECFYVIWPQWIFEAMLELFKRSQPIDFLNLRHCLEKKGRLEDAGGEDYILQLLNYVPTALHVESYAREVRDLYIRRKMIRTAEQIAGLAYDFDTSVEDMLEKGMSSIHGIGKTLDTGSCLPISQVVHEYFVQLERQVNGEQDQGGGLVMPTGFDDLDAIIGGGLARGDLFVIAARPGVGKTSLMLNIANHLARNHRKKVAFFSMEMSKEQILQRMLASRCLVDIPRLRLAKISDTELDEVFKALMDIHNLGIFLDDTPQLTPLELRLKMERLVYTHQVEAVFVDYLQLMRGSHGVGRFESRAYEIAYISSSLKAMARKLNIPVVVGSQLSRMVEQRADKRPMLSDLKESGAIEQDADVVLFIYREEMYVTSEKNKNTAEILVSKNRNGPTGKVSLSFDGKSASFRNKGDR